MATKIFQVVGEICKCIFTFSINCPCGDSCGEVFIQNFESIVADAGIIRELKSLDTSVHECKKTGMKFFFATAFLQGDEGHYYINCEVVGESSWR